MDAKSTPNALALNPRESKSFVQSVTKYFKSADSETFEISAAELQSDRRYRDAISGVKPDGTKVCQTKNTRCSYYVVGWDRAEPKPFAAHDEPANLDGMGYQSFFFRYYLTRITPLGRKLLRQGLLWTFDAASACPAELSATTAMIGRATLQKTSFEMGKRDFANSEFNLGGPIETASLEATPHQICMRDELPKYGTR